MPSDQAGRQQRLDALRALLEQEPVRGQGEIVARLRAQGLEVTQSSVSRDLHDLGVAKVKGRYVLLDGPSAAETRREPAMAAVVRTAVTGIATAGPNLLVVHTGPGAAMAVGLVIDEARWPEVVGTVAGDDTIFIATAGKRAQNRLVTRMRDLVPVANPAPARKAAARRKLPAPRRDLQHA